MWFLIGSQAIKLIEENFYRDVSNSDMDLYCSQDDFKDFIKNNKNIEKCFPLKKDKYRIQITGYPIIELKIYMKESVYDWLSQVSQKELLMNKKYKLNELAINVPNMNCLLALKQSHIYWPIHWLKNIEDLTWIKDNNKNSLDKINIPAKEIEFKRKIKNEMKVQHGKIPYGNISDKNHIQWKSIIENMNQHENYEKNLVHFIHYELSLKNKFKIINEWSNFKKILLSQKSKLII